MPTIYEIAKAAGVSPGTVSKALNKSGRINEKTRERIEKIADDMGYVPNIVAQSLKTNQSYVVGIVFPEGVGIGLEHMFFSKLLEAFRHQMADYGYDTIFINKKFGGRKIGYLEHCKLRQVDGLFVITVEPDDPEMDELLKSDIKCVTTEFTSPSTPYVMSDNIKGASLAVEYLVKMGHERIAHIAGDLSTHSAGERQVGFQEGMAHAGLSVDDSTTLEIGWRDNVEAGKMIKAFMNGFKDSERPTALFVDSDMLAILVIKVLSEMGLSVPDDISVVGFDDIRVSKMMNPELTTIRQDTDEIAKRIVDTLYAQIKNDYDGKEVPRVPVKLIERETVKKI